MKTSQEGVNFIKQFEGVRLKAYKAIPTEKYFTIGYGHYGADVKQDMVITHAEAEAYLRIDLQRFEKAVNALGLPLNQNQFNALVSFTYNCGAGNLKKLTANRTLPQIADAMLSFNHAGGKELAGLTRRRKAERELFLKGEDMNIIIGSARIDENGKAAGGKEGDQKQKSVPDYSGEVSMQTFYNHSKGWYILRPKSTDIALKMADSMKRACNNSNIGYDQGNRGRILNAGTNSKEPTECDCSSLVRKCIIEASGKDPGNFTTANEAPMLEATGLFEKRIEYTPGMKLYTGDVLVTISKGHTVIVTDGYSRESEANPYREPASNMKEGMSGNAIKWIQYQLNLFGYGLKEDGIFGINTKKAIMDFQSKHKDSNGKPLEVDGIVGLLTRTALKEK